MPCHHHRESIEYILKAPTPSYPRGRSGRHEGFASALKRVLRQTRIIMVGDEDPRRHRRPSPPLRPSNLVLSMLHTPDAAQMIDRTWTSSCTSAAGARPGEQYPHSICSQQLCRYWRRWIVATELATPAVRNCIREAKVANEDAYADGDPQACTRWTRTWRGW